MASNKCYICKVRDHRYTCPRCNVRYCSLQCYKHEKHADCSELFYRDWFIKEMKERNVTGSEKQRLLEMMKRVEEENPVVDFFEGNEASLEERLEGLNVEELKEDEVDELWSRLTLQEQEDFKKKLASGCAPMEINDLWEPWWLKHSSGLITEVEMEDDASDVGGLPNLIQNLSSLKSRLSGKTHSPLVAFNIVNVLYCYVFYQRMFNGSGCTEFLEDFCNACISSSLVLNANQSFTNVDESICASIGGCTDAAKNQDLTFDEHFSLECVQDVSHILIGPDPQNAEMYACCALSELHAACTKYRGRLKTEGLRKSLNHDHQDLRKQLFNVIKKLEFQIAWCSLYKEQLSLLSIELTEIYKQRAKDHKVHVELEKNILKHKSKTKPKSERSLIVELN